MIPPLPDQIPDIPSYVRARHTEKRLHHFDAARQAWSDWTPAVRLMMWPRVLAVRLGLIEDGLDDLKFSARAEYSGEALLHIQRTGQDLPRGQRRHHEQVLASRVAAASAP